MRYFVPMLCILVAGCGLTEPTYDEAAGEYREEQAKLVRLNQERSVITERYDLEFQNLEEGYAVAKKLPLEQVRTNPSEATKRSLKRWHASIQERRALQLAELERKIALQEERIAKAKEALEAASARSGRMPMAAPED